MGNVAEAEKLAATIEKTGGRALTARADVSDPQAVARMWDAAEAAFGSVDATLWLPTEIFAFDIKPNAAWRTTFLDGSVQMPISPDL